MGIGLFIRESNIQYLAVHSKYFLHHKYQVPSSVMTDHGKIPFHVMDNGQIDMI